MAKNVLTDMTAMLYEQAQRLYSAGKDEVEGEVERSRALDGLANGIRSNIGTQLAVERFRLEYGKPGHVASTRLLDNGK